MTRILDRFSTAGRKLSPQEKSAVSALNARYPTVPAKAAPAKGTVLTKKFSRMRTATKKQVLTVVSNEQELEVA